MEKAKCPLRGQEHPTNYKGCTVCKQIQKRKFLALRNRTIPNEQLSLNREENKFASKRTKPKL